MATMATARLPTPERRDAPRFERSAFLVRRQAGFLAACAGTAAAFTFLLVWRLAEAPPYLGRDEAGLGLASYLLATSGRDYFGHILPVYVQYLDHGELTNPILVYWAVPMVKVMGLSVVSVRASIALVGLLSLLLFAVVLWRLTSSRWLGLAGAWLLGTSPLFYIQSRVFIDPLLPIPFIIGWLLALVRLEETRQQRYVLLASLILGIGFYSYTLPRMLMPLYLVLTLVSYRSASGISWKTTLYALLVFEVALVPALVFVHQDPQVFSKRFRVVSWLTDDNARQAPVTSFVSRYVAAFDPRDLFLTGDESLHHSTGRVGAFLLATAPLALAGLATLASQAWRRQSTIAFVVLAALLLFPAPIALLKDMRHVAWGTYVLPLYALVCVAGLRSLASRARKSRSVAIAVGALGLVAAIQFSVFLWDYHTEYPVRAAAAGYFDGNRPLGFRTIMELAPERFYVDQEDTLTNTFVRFFQVAYAYQGSVALVQPTDGAAVPAGALLLTQRPAAFAPAFEEVQPVPELERDLQLFFILRRIGDRPST